MISGGSAKPKAHSPGRVPLPRIISYLREARVGVQILPVGGPWILDLLHRRWECGRIVEILGKRIIGSQSPHTKWPRRDEEEHLENSRSRVNVGDSRWPCCGQGIRPLAPLTLLDLEMVDFYHVGSADE